VLLAEQYLPDALCSQADRRPGNRRKVLVHRHEAKHKTRKTKSVARVKTSTGPSLRENSIESRLEHWTELERKFHRYRDLAPRPSKSGPDLNAAGLKNKSSNDSGKNHEARNRPDLTSTAKLRPWLRNDELTRCSPDAGLQADK
jgi:hypothetical protein